MKDKTLPLALFGSLVLLMACGKEPAADPEPQPASSTPAVSRNEIIQTANPLTGQVSTVERIHQLPSDAFFQEYNYPGSSVLDVKAIFGTPTVWLSTSDDYEKVDAFYKQKFTAQDGTIQGRVGSYYRITGDNRMEKAAFTKTTGGLIEIVLTM